MWKEGNTVAASQTKVTPDTPNSETNRREPGESDFCWARSRGSECLQTHNYWRQEVLELEVTLGYAAWVT